MTKINCPQCNLVNFAVAFTCKRCNFRFEENIPATNNPPLVRETAVSPPRPRQNFLPVQANYQYQPINTKSHGIWDTRNRKLAVMSLISGILSFPLINQFLTGFLSGILGNSWGQNGFIAGLVIGFGIVPMSLLTGILALNKARKYPNDYRGTGLATAGIVLGGFGLVVNLLFVVIVFPILNTARQDTNEKSALHNLKILVKAQKDYNAANRTKLCASLNDFLLINSIDSKLASGTKDGYNFSLTSTPEGCNFLATPKSVSGILATGKRSFFASTEEFMIRGGDKKGLPADFTDTPVASVFKNLGGISQDADITEITVVSNLKKIYEAQNYLYDNFKAYSKDLREMRARQLISATLANGDELGYRYVILLNQNGGYEVLATPLSAQPRSFYMSQDGKIRAEFHQGSAASSSDPEIE